MPLRKINIWFGAFVENSAFPERGRSNKIERWQFESRHTSTSPKYGPPWPNFGPFVVLSNISIVTRFWNKKKPFFLSPNVTQIVAATF